MDTWNNIPRTCVVNGAQISNCSCWREEDELKRERSHNERMQLQKRSRKGQIWLTEVTQSETSEFGKQSGKNVLDSWHINTKTELCGRLSVLHSTCEGGDIWLNCWGMCTFTDHYVLDGLSRQRERKLQKVLIKAPSFFYNSSFKARRSDGGFLWELAGFLSWSWYGHGFGRESQSLTGVFTVSYTH